MLSISETPNVPSAYLNTDVPQKHIYTVPCTNSDDELICDSSEDDMGPSFVTIGPFVSNSTKKYAENILDIMETLKGVTDTNQLGILLRQIIDFESQIKFKDPFLYCSYSYDGRCGTFNAFGCWTLSEVITARVCRMKFSYSDVLGKHSELTFKTNDIEFEYQDSMPEEEETSCYDLNFNRGRCDYDNNDDISQKVLHALRKHMFSLEPVAIDIYVEYREDELESFAKQYLESLILTTDPSVAVSSPLSC